MDDDKPERDTSTEPESVPHGALEDGREDEVGLTATEVAILELEQSWWKHHGAKETAIHDRFGWTMTRYYQVLNVLIDTSAALAHDPVTVNRLRRLRAERQRVRKADQPH